MHGISTSGSEVRIHVFQRKILPSHLFTVDSACTTRLALNLSVRYGLILHFRSYSPHAY